MVAIFCMNPSLFKSLLPFLSRLHLPHFAPFSYEAAACLRTDQSKIGWPGGSGHLFHPDLTTLSLGLVTFAYFGH